MPNSIIRDDLSNKLIHLTRDKDDQVAAGTLLKILQEKKLRGGNTYIKGNHKCVCFSEAPIAKLSQILANPTVHGIRYKPFGIMVDKEWLFARGGRPVIYQTDTEYNLLHDDMKFRHVRYEPHNKIDHTWEREWRIFVEELELESDTTSVVLPNRAWEDWLQKQHESKLARRALITHGFLGPRSVVKQPWHYIVLEDLGVSVPDVEPPPHD